MRGWAWGMGWLAAAAAWGQATPEQAAHADALRTAAMNKPGDPKKGKELFASKELKCAVCHKATGQAAGGEAGPDLALVGGKFHKTNLIEAVLDPSAFILEGYRTNLVELADGRTLTGIVKDETPAGFKLFDAENKQHAIAAKDVVKRQNNAQSLMPAGLCATCSAEQFCDLVAYLETLRSGRKPSPGESVFGTLELPPGFVATPVGEKLDAATALTLCPDGRILVSEQTGALRVIKDGKLLPAPFVKLPVAATMERGLLGVAVPPDFPKTPYVYVLYGAEKPFTHHVLARFTAAGDVAEPGSEKILFEGDDQSKLGGNRTDLHQGGPLHFGADGKLYVALGDQTANAPAQRMDTLLGKILRLNVDGSIPEDNPFFKTAEGKYRAIWALGCRNPFGMAVQAKTGRIFINDVGGKAEEINEGVAGANYGWPTADHGPTSDPAFTGPQHHYPTACITGGAFSPSDSPWPAEYRGQYFFADFNHGFLRVLDPAAPAKSRGFAAGVRRPVDLRFAPNGDLYLLCRDAWLLDKFHKPGTGMLLRITHAGTAGKAAAR